MSLTCRGTGRAIVGNRSAHHQYVGPWQRGQHGREHFPGRSGPRDRHAGRQWYGQLAGDEAHLGPGLDKRPGKLDPHPARRAVGNNPNRVERLLGAPGGHDDAGTGE